MTGMLCCERLYTVVKKSTPETGVSQHAHKGDNNHMRTKAAIKSRKKHIKLRFVWKNHFIGKKIWKKVKIGDSRPRMTKKSSLFT